MYTDRALEVGKKMHELVSKLMNKWYEDGKSDPLTIYNTNMATQITNDGHKAVIKLLEKDPFLLSRAYLDDL